MFLLITFGSIASAIIFFALAKLIDNQENIMIHLSMQEEYVKKKLSKKIICSKCAEEYRDEIISCPYCGHREQ